MILPLADMEPAGPFAEPRPSMRGPYSFRNRSRALAMAIIDSALSLVPARRGRMPAAPERILLAHWAHLGDVTTAIGALTALRERHPHARIGMLVGSSGRLVLAKTGLVDDLHVIDHPMLSRAEGTWPEKIRRYRTMRATALGEMRSIDYQVGIDLYMMFPPAHPLFFQAGIPVRVGFTSNGFGPLLTHPVRWTDPDRPIADQYRVLLDQLDPMRPFTSEQLRPRRDRDTLASPPAEIEGASPYVVLHPGAGAPFKDWGAQNWHELVRRLRLTHPALTLVVTGAGAGETALAEDLAAANPGVVALAGRVSWEGFVSTVAGAALVICPDTATGHIAALFDTPVVSIFTGTNKTSQWAPYGRSVTVLTRPVRCAPCNRAGCTAMACVREVPIDAVWRAATSWLTAAPESGAV